MIGTSALGGKYEGLTGQPEGGHNAPQRKNTKVFASIRNIGQ